MPKSPLVPVFSRARLAVALLIVCSLLLPVASASSGPAELPNLIPLFDSDDPFVLSGDEEVEAPSGRGLHFSSLLLNAGPHSLELQGGAPSIDDPMAASAAQCVSFDDVGICETSEGAIPLRWHPADDVFLPEYCFSIESLTRYELRSVIGGAPDFSASGLKASHTIDQTIEDEQAHGDYDTDESVPTYSACPLTLRQGLSVGRMERRDGEHRDQYIDLAGRNGTFALVIRADPLDRIREANEGDNTAFIIIKIAGPDITVIER